MVWMSWLAADALACGGFFCNNTEPVDQTGETIVFEVEDGTVTTHVMVQYEGDAADFSWVLPVPGIPEVFLSTEALFDTLQVWTEPVPILRRSWDEGCDTTYSYLDYAGYSSSTASPVAEDDGVEILATPRVGPYVGVVIDAVDAASLVTWLTDNGFGIPPNFAQAAAPYLAGDMNFLVFKLDKDASAGDLPPLGVKWPGTQPSVPLTLTSVAAQPDLPLTVYVLGEMRAVPLSYLHVQMNPLVYDWFRRGRNWLEMVTKAMDEAGGRGFATTYAGPVQQPYLGCDAMNTSGLASIDSALNWFLELRGHGFFGTPEVLAVLRDHVPAPAGVDEVSFYNFPEEYAAAWTALDATFDPVAATAALDERVVQPCVDAEEILGRSPYVTRLTSTISPEEMTVDPTFGFNPNLPDVSNILEAELHNNCDGTSTLTLPGGYELLITSPGDRAEPTDSWIDERLEHHALVIEQLSEDGTEILADYREELVGDTLEDVAGACGCSSTGGGAGLWVLSLGLVGLRRRARS